MLNALCIDFDLINATLCNFDLSSLFSIDKITQVAGGETLMLILLCTTHSNKQISRCAIHHIDD